MLSQGYLKEPHVSVEVTTYRPFYIIGAVAKPGEYPYVSHMNALNAVALAGGFTLLAIDSVVYVRHEGSTAEHRMPADESTIIRPGDVVRVEMTPFWDVMSLISPLTGFAAIAATRP
jgi:polysaccharide export outer membrane protein